MKIEFENVTINFLPFIIAAIILFLLMKWGKELENRRFTLFFYFLISSYIAPLYSRYTETGGLFQIWFPLGFVLVTAYLHAYKRSHPAKIKASLLGLILAIYLLIQKYIDFPLD
ncbi:hypothetical protein [Neobacillus muris]|uniref:hypothetical protein n=1 Tax=Neobacillus muris TaxID=2941334 RepID=UPI00204265D9|nr:hypothetical protein [Neobacillus muris]